MKKHRLQSYRGDYNYYKPREVSSFTAEVGRFILFLLAGAGWTYWMILLMVD